MFNGEDFVTAKGVTLTREFSGENRLWVRLFVQNEGIISLSSKNFMGDSEPFLWAVYAIRKQSKNAKYFVTDIDVKDDMFAIRRSRQTIQTALKWTRFLIKYVPHEQPDDSLLANLYWNMKLLANPSIPYSAAEWRFIWLWLEHWGIAPDIVDFHSSKNFNDDEISLLIQTSHLNAKGVIKLFSSPVNANVRQNVFTVAANLATGFLRQL